MEVRTEDLIEAIEEIGGKIIDQRGKFLTINGIVIGKNEDGEYISNSRELFRCVYPREYGYKILVPDSFSNRMTSKIVLRPA